MSASVNPASFVAVSGSASSHIPSAAVTVKLRRKIGAFTLTEPDFKL